MVTVFSTTDPQQAALIQVVLRDAGVEFRIDNENAPWLSVGMPSAAARIVIQVAEDKADASRKAIEEALTRMGDAPTSS